MIDDISTLPIMYNEMSGITVYLPSSIHGQLFDNIAGNEQFQVQINQTYEIIDCPWIDDKRYLAHDAAKYNDQRSKKMCSLPRNLDARLEKRWWWQTLV